MKQCFQIILNLVIIGFFMIKAKYELFQAKVIRHFHITITLYIFYIENSDLIIITIIMKNSHGEIQWNMHFRVLVIKNF